MAQHTLRAIASLTVVGLVVAGGSANAVNIVVTTLDDNPADAAHCTLRQALTTASGSAPVAGSSCATGQLGEDQIDFAPGLAGVILLVTGNGPLPVISEPLVINGPENAALTIDANVSYGIFTVINDASLYVDDLTLAGGSSILRGGAIDFGGTGQLTVVRTVFRDNTAPGFPTGTGGAIYSSANMTLIIDSTFSSNFAFLDGGAVSCSGICFFMTSTFHLNQAGRYGGAVYLAPNATQQLSTINQTTFVGNVAIGIDALGGALAIGANVSLMLDLSTFSDNRVDGAPPGDRGGALAITANGSSITLARSLFSGNSSSFDADDGCFSAPGILTTTYSVFDGPGRFDCNGFSVDNVDSFEPLLGPLGDHGGPTQTMLPRGDAIDAIPAGQCGGIDQRGVLRPQGAGCDAGAVEVRAGAAIVVDEAGCTLAQAVAAANTNTAVGACPAGGELEDAITFNAVLAGADVGVGAEMSVQGALTITGPTPRIHLFQFGGGRIFTVQPNASLGLQNLTLSGGITPNTDGGCIHTAGATAVNDVTFSGCVSFRRGGAVFVETPGTLSAVSTRFLNNRAPDGGAVAGNGLMSFDRSTFDANAAIAAIDENQHRGGAVFASYTTVTIRNSTFAYNTAVNSVDHHGFGGAIYSFGAIFVVDFSTFVSNLVSGDFSVPAEGGTFAVFPGTAAGSIQVRDSIVNYGSAGDVRDECYNPDGAAFVFTNVLASTDTSIDCGAAAAFVEDVQYPAPADNGGPTPTVRLPATSLGVDAAPCGALTTDQRGVARPLGAQCDIGAYELYYTDLAVTLDAEERIVMPPGGTTYTFGIEAKNQSVLTTEDVGVECSFPFDWSFVSDDAAFTDCVVSGSDSILCPLFTLTGSTTRSWNVSFSVPVDTIALFGGSIVCNIGSDTDDKVPSDNSDVVNVLAALQICGDGYVDPPESCDDGDAFGGDGCSETCLEEPGWTCDETNGSSSCSCLPTYSDPDPSDGDPDCQRVDYGDAPTTFGTLVSNDGARHVIVGDPATALRLGATVTADSDGSPGAGASGDSGDDGLSPVPQLPRFMPSLGLNATVSAANGAPYELRIWVDFNRDGDFADGGELFSTTTGVGTGGSQLVFPSGAVPETASPGASFMRLRLATSLDGVGPTGLAGDGEVEDYAVAITEALPTDVDVTLGTTLSPVYQGLASNVVITPQNKGNLVTSGVKVDVSKPAGMIYEGLAAVGCADMGTFVRCDFGSIAAFTTAPAKTLPALVDQTRTADITVALVGLTHGRPDLDGTETASVVIDVRSCGDGLVAAGNGESCDDGDNDVGDGCNAICVTEVGWVCTGAPSVCTKRVDLKTLTAAFEDTETYAGLQERFEATFENPSNHDVTATIAFGAPTAGLSFASFVAASGLACTGTTVVTCTLPMPAGSTREATLYYQVAAAPTTASASVAITSLASGEIDPDPGNNLGNDSIVLLRCGDSVHSAQFGETCDDGDATNGDGCSACQLDPGWTCSGTVCTRIEADLEVTAFAFDTAVVYTGDIAVLEYTIKNNGPSAATNVVWKITLPNPTTLAVNDVPAFCTVLAGVATCTLATLANGASVDVVFEFVAPSALPQGSSMAKMVSLTADELDTVPGNATGEDQVVPRYCGDSQITNGETCDDGNRDHGDGCSGVTGVPSEHCRIEAGFLCQVVGQKCRPSADLETIAIGFGQSSIYTGQRLAMTTTIKNNGPLSASDIVLTVSLPDAATTVFPVDLGSECTVASGVMTCRFGTLAPAQTHDFVVDIGTALPPSVELATFTVASLISDDIDPLTANNAGDDVLIDVLFCGDGERFTGERCDDDNVAAGDGCSPGCKVESGWLCDALSPSTCVRDFDLEASASFSAPSVYTGGAVTLNLLVRNVGGGDSDVATLAVALPSGLTLVDDGVCTTVGAATTCPLGVMPRLTNARFALELTASTTTSTSAVATATIVAPNDSFGDNDVSVATTRLEFCGDAVKNGPEQCDGVGGNADLPDRCRRACLLPRCGDGIADKAGGAGWEKELCDDGNGTPDDDCPDGPDGSCSPNVCDDGFPDHQGADSDCQDLDDDGFNDSTEIRCGSDPTDGASSPNDLLHDPDRDGACDADDDDDDGDDWSDAEEATCLTNAHSAASVPPDGDADTLCDELDPNDDGDDSDDAIEALCGTAIDDPAEEPSAADLADTDGDTEIDCADADDDDDDVSDVNEGVIGSDPLVVDSDGDGLPDGVENRDHDGAVDPGETSPVARDTDLDGLDDDVEVDSGYPLDASLSPSDGTLTDSDADGLPDGAEDADHDGAESAGETNPLVADSDGDRAVDGEEIACDSDPLDGDSVPLDLDDDGTCDGRQADGDEDGVSDGVEVLCGTAPDNRSSTPSAVDLLDHTGDGLLDCIDPDDDDDGFEDLAEVHCGFDPLAADSFPTAAGVLDYDGDETLDCRDLDDDNDELADTDEAGAGTDAHDSDSDDDGISDGRELALGTEPTNADSDGDGLQDGTELGYTAGTADTDLAVFMPDTDPQTVTSPRATDSDKDGVSDGDEDTNKDGWVHGDEGDPLWPIDGLLDSDGDGINDKDERALKTDPRRTDTDDDGLDDKAESEVHLTDPRNPDTDGGSLLDGEEIAAGKDPLSALDDVPKVADESCAGGAMPSLLALVALWMLRRRQGAAFRA